MKIVCWCVDTPQIHSYKMTYLDVMNPIGD